MHAKQTDRLKIPHNVSTIFNINISTVLSYQTKTILCELGKGISLFRDIGLFGLETILSSGSCFLLYRRWKSVSC